MKKIYYENGPDEIYVGPENAKKLIRRGEPTEFDDAFADKLLAKKHMFKESKNAESKEQRAKG
jgi:hypothetical protein